MTSIRSRLDVFESYNPTAIWWWSLSTSCYLWLPPLLQAMLVNLITLRVRNHVSGTNISRPQLMWRSLYSNIIVCASIVTAVAALFDMAVGNARPALGFLELYLGLTALLITTARQPVGIAFAWVTNGSLYDGLQNISKKCSIPVKGLLLAKSRTATTANAFALTNRRVMVTDTILNELTKDELDSIIAHELAHIKLKHIKRKRAICFSTVCAPVACLMFPALQGSFTAAIGGIYIIAFTGYGILLWCSRRMEFAADHHAVLMTGKPRELITALIKLHSSRGLPISWSNTIGLFLSHPPTQERINRIAKLGNISETECKSIQQSAQITAVDHYAVPCFQHPFAVLSTEPSATYLYLASTLGHLFVAGALPVLLGVHNLYFLLFASLVAGVMNRATINLVRRACGLARIRLITQQRAQSHSTDETIPVFVSPPSTPGSVVGITFRDAMNLTVKHNHLIFRGKEVEFQVERGEVCSVTSGARTSILSLTRTTIVSVQKLPDDAVIHFTVSALSVPWAGTSRVSENTLRELLLSWLNCRGSFPPATHEEMVLPSVHDVVDTNPVNFNAARMAYNITPLMFTMPVMWATAVALDYPSNIAVTLGVLAVLTLFLGLRMLRIMRVHGKTTSRNPIALTKSQDSSSQ